MRYGTCVGHDDKRLLSYEPGARKQWEEVIIDAPDADSLAFTIEFPNNRVEGGEYWKKLQAFVNDIRRALPSVSKLSLDNNPPTAPSSRQSRTPRKLPIYLDDEEIGHGGFASVIRIIDARDGKVCGSEQGTRRSLLTLNGQLGIHPTPVYLSSTPVDFLYPCAQLTRCILHFVFSISWGSYHQIRRILLCWRADAREDSRASCVSMLVLDELADMRPA